jgi:hypothetical protein
VPPAKSNREMMHSENYHGFSEGVSPLLVEKEVCMYLPVFVLRVSQRCSFLPASCEPGSHFLWVVV